MGKTTNEKALKSTITLLGFQCSLKFDRYLNDTICITAIDKDEELFVCTVNWEANFNGATTYAKTFPFPAVVIKNYSENEGMIDALQQAGVIQKGGAYLSGSGGTVEARLLSVEWQAECAKQLLLAKQDIFSLHFGEEKFIKVGDKVFTSNINIDNGHTNTSIGDHESTMTLYAYPDKSFGIEWDVPSADETVHISIWADGKELHDYDGVFELPKEAIELLESFGMNCEYAKD